MTRTAAIRKYKCGICGVTADTCGSWTKCGIFAGYVCGSCCWHCTNREKFNDCSITWCRAGMDKKIDRR